MRRACLTTLAVLACRVAVAALTPPVRIAFQEAPGNGSEPVGWLADNALAYDAGRGYGWYTSGVPADIPIESGHGSRWRTDGVDPINPDPLLNGCVRFWEVDSWQADIPDGVYKVTVCCGEPSGTSPNTVLIDGELILDHYPRNNNQFHTEWAIIEVTGGTGVRITKYPPVGTDDDCTDIAYIEFEQIGALAAAQRLVLRQDLNGYVDALDTHIISTDPTSSPSDWEDIYVGLYTDSAERRSFVKFGLGGHIPAGMGIALADLRAWCHVVDDELGYGPEAFAADTDWDGSVTWNTGSSISGASLGVYQRPGRTAWGYAGEGHTSGSRWYHWDATPGAWQWMAGFNYGVLLEEESSVTAEHYTRMRSSEYAADQTLRPTLVLALKDNPNNPTASIDEPTVDPVKTMENEAVSFTGSGTDPDGHNIVLYVWDWKDGSQEYSTDPAVSHAWTGASTYTVELRVVDELGGVSAPDAITVWVRSPAEIPPDLRVERIDLQGQVSDDMGAAQVVYVSVDGSRVPVSSGLWSASDVPAAPTEGNPATVTITGRDASGNAGTIEIKVEVQDL